MQRFKEYLEKSDKFRNIGNVDVFPRIYDHFSLSGKPAKLSFGILKLYILF